ncbi:MAG: EVE domain-containing protein [Gemmataceae bacterium]|nr:EVE domain-containing protein [Gemmataceae bacterium]
MARWLFKQEPGCYSFADLMEDGSTAWDGVGNALAVKHLKAAKEGDLVFFYETGKAKAVVGVMRIVAAGEAPTVEPVEALPRPVALAELKALPELAEWDLVRLPRLSVVPVSAAHWKAVEKLARTPP